MNNLTSPPPEPAACPQPFSRRQALLGAACGFGYLAFAGLAHRAAAAAAASPGSALAPRTPHFAPRARRVLFLCMKGGPSHVDSFDHKPELTRADGQVAPFLAGGGARLLGSPFEFSQHGESGLWISELFPRLARHADKLCLLRGMHTDLPNHPQAFLQLHTGSFQFVRPSLGSWTLYGLGSDNENLPGFITLNPPTDFGGVRNYGNAFLPSAYQGTRIGSGQIPELYAALLGRDQEPGPPLRHLENERHGRAVQRAQVDLINGLNRRRLLADPEQPEIEGAIESMELAFRMQAEIPGVLELQNETESTLGLYGIGDDATDRFGRQCLLARRLLEAGVRFVEVTAPTDWDHHHLLRDSMVKSCATVDQPIAGLLTDLDQRGLLQDTLVIWAGEFGRTPYAQGLGDGRDHNHRGFTIWMAGGGVRGGHSHGATDEFGYMAREQTMHIHDLHATILHLLGLDHRDLTFRHAGRNFRLTDVHGRIAHEILA